MWTPERHNYECAVNAATALLARCRAARYRAATDYDRAVARAIATGSTEIDRRAARRAKVAAGQARLAYDEAETAHWYLTAIMQAPVAPEPEFLDIDGPPVVYAPVESVTGAVPLDGPEDVPACSVPIAVFDAWIAAGRPGALSAYVADWARGTVNTAWLDQPVGQSDYLPGAVAVDGPIRILPYLD
jgi:hypothetical protein